MDVISGLAAASQAIQLVRDIRDIDRSVDEASFKLKLAELTSVLADTKIALSEARTLIAEKDEELSVLRKQLEEAKSGEMCSICRLGKLRVVAVREHPEFGVVGIQERELQCSNELCLHKEKHLHDPRKVLSR